MTMTDTPSDPHPETGVPIVTDVPGQLPPELDPDDAPPIDETEEDDPGYHEVELEAD